ncbi:MAG: potassium channel protein [Candidatus Poribacteria bacterium]|nr:MAG: potassium channel protein [Candidatus Poribacteria bacterium]
MRSTVGLWWRLTVQFLQRQRPVFLALTGIVLGGTIGYRLLEGLSPLEALYMTVITITTVGFGEVRPLSPEGRLFTIFLILSGAVTATYFFGATAEFLLEGEWRGLLAQRWKRKQMERMRNHVIVCGYGRVGRHVVRELLQEEIPFVVIDRDETAIAQVPDAARCGLVGDASDEEVLQLAGIERARCLVAALPEDADNVFVVLTARSLNPQLFIVARTNRDESEAKLLKAGANRVITPYKISAHRMVTMILRPEVSEFLDAVMQAGTVEFLLEQVLVPPDSPLTGKTLGELRIRSQVGVNVLAIRSPDGQLITSPGPETPLLGGSRVIVLGTRDQLKRFSGFVGVART